MIFINSGLDIFTMNKKKYDILNFRIDICKNY